MYNGGVIILVSELMLWVSIQGYEFINVSLKHESEGYVNEKID